MKRLFALVALPVITVALLLSLSGNAQAVSDPVGFCKQAGGVGAYFQQLRKQYTQKELTDYYVADAAAEIASGKSIEGSLTTLRMFFAMSRALDRLSPSMSPEDVSRLITQMCLMDPSRFSGDK